MKIKTKSCLFAVVLSALLLPSLFAATHSLGVEQASVRTAADRMAFVLAGRLWLSGLDGSSVQAIPVAADEVESPVLSTDGKHLVFLLWKDDYHTAALQYLDIASGQSREILATEDAPAGFDVDFQAGEIVLALAGKGLSSVTLQDGSRRQLTEKGSDRNPHFSSDGRQIAFVRSAGDSQDIWVLEKSSGSLRRVQSSVQIQDDFDWAPDDSRFVLESFDTGNLELWTLPAQGGAARRITDDIALEQAPEWAGSDAIYFHKNRRLWRMKADGSNPEAVDVRVELEGSGPASLLIQHTNVLDVVTGDWKSDQDILVREGMIERVASGIAAPDTTPVLDAGGAWAIPGLLDLHTHFEPWMKTLMQQYGIAVMRDLGSSRGTDWILSRKAFVGEGLLDGPEILAAGVVMNGSGPATLGQFRTDDPEQVAETVQWLADQGVDLIKIGSENTYPLLEATIKTAHANHLPVWGHIAFVLIPEAIRLGQDGIEHLRGSAWSALAGDATPAPVPRRLTGMRREGAAWWGVPRENLLKLARLMAEKRVMLDPTLTVMQTLGETEIHLPEGVTAKIPSRVLRSWEKGRREPPLSEWGPEDFQAFSGARENQKYFVKAFSEAGGLVTTGSDIGVENVIPGLSVHQEMEYLVDAGLTPFQALQAATLNAAKAARIENHAGQIKAGFLGTLLLLDENPLQDIRKTQRIRHVVERGRVIPEPAISRKD